MPIQLIITGLYLLYFGLIFSQVSIYRFLGGLLILMLVNALAFHQGKSGRRL